MAISPHCVFQRGTSPIVAAAIHNGHDTRPRVDKRLAIDPEQQLREEDPITGEWAQIAKTQFIGLRSRFEVDFNRPRDKAVYKTPADAWGMELWNEPPDEEMIEASLREYDEFYRETESLIRDLIDEFGKVVVYDLH